MSDLYSDDPEIQETLERCREGTAWRGKLIAAELAALRDQIKLAEEQEPDFYTSRSQIAAVKNGANRYVMAREAKWVRNPTENDVALYTKGPK